MWKRQHCSPSRTGPQVDGNPEEEQRAYVDGSLRVSGALVAVALVASARVRVAVPRRRARRQRGRPERGPKRGRQCGPERRRQRGRQRGPERRPRRRRPGRRSAQPRGLAGLRRRWTGGEQIAGAPDWVTPFEKQTGCKVNAKIYGGSSDEVALMKTGRVRRRSRLGRRHAAADRGRRCRGRQHEPDPELRQRLRGPQGQEPQHGQRRPLRGPARSWREHPDVADRHGPARPRQLERRLGRRQQVRRQGHRLRLRDLHRRRGRLPDVDQAGARDQGSVRARRHAVRGRRRPAQGAAPEHHHVLERRRGADRRLHEGRHGRRARPGRPRSTP